MFLMLEARDPISRQWGTTSITTPRKIRFGVRYAEAPSTAEDGRRVADLTRTGAPEPDLGDRQEQGWTEREEIRE